MLLVDHDKNVTSRDTVESGHASSIGTGVQNALHVIHENCECIYGTPLKSSCSIFASHHPCKKPRSPFLNGKPKGCISTHHTQLVNNTTIKYLQIDLCDGKRNWDTWLRSSVAWPSPKDWQTWRSENSLITRCAEEGKYIHFNCIDKGELYQVQVIQFWPD